MGFFDFLSDILGSSHGRSYNVPVVDIDNLFKRDGLVFCWKKYARRPQYKWNEIPYINRVNGRKVKLWLLYYGADDQDGDDYVPIFYGERLPRKRIRTRKKIWKRHHFHKKRSKRHRRP